MASVKDTWDGFKAAFGPRAAAESLPFLENLGRHTAEAAPGIRKVGGLLLDAAKFIPRITVVPLAKASLWVSSEFGGRGVGYIAKQPVISGLKLGTGVVNTVRAHPVLAGAAAAGTALLAGNAWLRGSAEQQTQSDLMAQAMAAQNGFAPQQSYMNSVTPDEWAAVQARVSAKDDAPQGAHTGAVVASREAAAAGAAPQA
jgi:hypothetical protein